MVCRIKNDVWDPMQADFSHDLLLIYEYIEVKLFDTIAL